MKPAPSCTGNISNQKYEAAKLVRQHFMLVTTASPTYETSRWKNEQLDHYHFQKQKGKVLLGEKKINDENQFLDERLKAIYTENRKETTQEYAPGLRVGTGKSFDPIISLNFSPSLLGGTCIDCYPSSTHDMMQEKKRQIQLDQKRTFHEKRHQENLHISEYLKNARSSYERDRLLEEYDVNHAKLPMFSKTSQTATYLGLLSTKELLKPNKSAQINAAIAASSPKNVPQSLQNNSSFVQSKKTHVSKRSSNRPLSSNDVKRIHQHIKRAKEISRPMSPDRELKQLEEMLTTRHLPPNEVWNLSTNDNYHNSNYNNKHLPRRDETVYGPLKEDVPNYLVDRVDILTLAKQREQEEKERQMLEIEQLRQSYPQRNGYMLGSGMTLQGYITQQPHMMSSQSNPNLNPVESDDDIEIENEPKGVLTRPQSAPVLLSYGSPRKKLPPTNQTNVPQDILQRKPEEQQHHHQLQQQQEKKLKEKLSNEKDSKNNSKESTPRRNSNPKVNEPTTTTTEKKKITPQVRFLEEKKKSNDTFKHYLQNSKNIIGVVKQLSKKNVSFREDISVREFGDDGNLTINNATIIDSATNSNTLTPSTYTGSGTTNHLSLAGLSDKITRMPTQKGLSRVLEEVKGGDDIRQSPREEGRDYPPSRASSMLSVISELTVDEPQPMKYQHLRQQFRNRPDSTDSGTKDIEEARIRFTQEIVAKELKTQVSRQEHEEQLIKAQQNFTMKRLQREQKAVNNRLYISKDDPSHPYQEDILLLEDELLESLNIDLLSKYSFPIRCDNICNSRILNKNNHRIDIRNIGKVAFMIYEIGYCLKGSKENLQLMHHEYPALQEMEKENQEALQHLLQKNLYANLGPNKPLFNRNNSKDNNINQQQQGEDERKDEKKERSKSPSPIPPFSPTNTSDNNSNNMNNNLNGPNSFLTYSKFKNQNLDTSNSFLLTCTGLLIAVYLLPHSSTQPYKNKTYKYYSLKDLYNIFSTYANDRNSKYRHQSSDLLTIFDEVFSFSYPYGEIDYPTLMSPILLSPLPPSSSTPNRRKSQLIVNKKNFHNRKSSFCNIVPSPLQEEKTMVYIDEHEKDGAIVYPCLLDMMDSEMMMNMIEIIMNHIEIRQINPNQSQQHQQQPTSEQQQQHQHEHQSHHHRVAISPSRIEPRASMASTSSNTEDENNYNSDTFEGDISVKTLPPQMSLLQRAVSNTNIPIEQSSSSPIHRAKSEKIDLDNCVLRIYG